ncbi:MAG: fructosamine kinase family protein [Aggregatilineales bacterium]|nr:fructosamine kinase family protein [Chloroflexota bacterium]HOA25167.1 fructosamine kinase family protein [Aggregatilineales bacterium]HPV06762.1 fructosamine kinase family protein [Aggregatilineales bacterium]
MKPGGYLSDDLKQAISQTLRAAGDDSPLKEVSTVGGGDINHAARVTTAQNRYFVKWHQSPPPRFFDCEARGICLLRDAGAVRVPDVIGHGRVPNSHTEYLILEWIDRNGSRYNAARELGRQLAMQHKQVYPSYGLEYDNYIGELPQKNRRTRSWVNFYRSERLGVQRDLAAQRGLLPRERARRLDQLIERLDRWLDERLTHPSLLHGDLWGGNWMVALSGEPVIIDPAVYFGDREADLAMTALFGGFPPDFYQAYNEVFPLAPGYEERQPLYQLYYLLVHLNLFGESYGSRVDSILSRYVG